MYPFLCGLHRMMKASQEMALTLMWWPWSTLPLPSILIVDVGKMGFLQMCFLKTCRRAIVVFDWLFVCQHAVVKRGPPPLNWANQLCDEESVPGLQKLPKDNRLWAEHRYLSRKMNAARLAMVCCNYRCTWWSCMKYFILSSYIDWVFFV